MRIVRKVAGQKSERIIKWTNISTEKKTKRELSEWCISLHNPHLLSRDDTMFLLDNIPAADVEPVVHGRWAHLGGDEWCCSACGFVITTEGSWDKPTKKYCEDCGARMDGDKCH